MGVDLYLSALGGGQGSKESGGKRGGGGGNGAGTTWERDVRLIVILIGMIMRRARGLEASEQ